MFSMLEGCTVHVRSSIRQPFGDLVSVCFHTSSTFQHPLRNCIRPAFLQSSMSGWMAEMADVVDAAQAQAPAPPVTKAAPPQSTMHSSIDDTPTEPATSPRTIGSQVREWRVELQLPTGEIGPREEPERYATRFILNDGQWTPEEHEEALRKAAQAGNYQAWNREIREAALREKREHDRSVEEWKAQVKSQGFEDHAAIPWGPPPKQTSSMRALPEVHEALRQNDPSKAPGSQPVLKKPPPTTGRPMPAGFYSGEPPRIGTAPQCSLHHHPSQSIHGMFSLKVLSIHQQLLQ